MNRVTWLGLALLVPLEAALGKLEDVEKAQERARAGFIERFTEFTQDKNFVGKAQTPTGETVQGKRKTRFNADDGGPYQSDLTYHDFAYDVDDDTFAKQQQQANANGNQNANNGPSSRQLYAGVSNHGAISGAGGSSLLERTAYQLHDQFAKAEDKKERDKKNREEGFRYEGVFKIDTQEVINKNKTEKGEDNVPDKKDRWQLREEARPQIEQVGTQSFDTLENAAKDPENQGNPQAMGTLSKYYKAANESLKLLWNSTLSNYFQRSAFKAIEPNDASNNVQLSEDARDCNAWRQKAAGKLEEKDPQRRDKIIQDYQRMAQQCEQITKMNFREIAPRFESDPNAGPGSEKLVMEGADKEDARMRDMRVNLELMNKVGTRASEVQSNWKYDEKDEKNQITVGYDEQGQAVEKREMRMDEQVDSYNEQLRAAAKDLEEVRSRYDGLKTTPDQILQYQIQPKSKSAIEITQFPAQAADEQFETIAPTDSKVAETYEDLIKKQQAE